MYGGTKTEMQRLLKDAQKISGVKYNINNLNDVYEAIHVIQTEMGITGTTAKEASETISGSFAMAGSAWQNLMTGMADGSQDMDLLIDNFVSSALVAVGNITKILPALTSGVSKLIEGFLPHIPEMMNAVLPALIEGAVSLISGLVSILPSLLSSIGTAISTAWTGIVWPMIQGFFKAKFDIELPDWEDLGTTISDGWSDKVWPKIQGFLSQYYDIELPDWETTATNISTWWADVKTSIGSLFEVVFTVFTEDEDGKSVFTRISTWWAKVQGSIFKLFQAVFSVFTEDEDGNFAIVRIGDWWAKVTASIGDLFQTVFSVFAEDEDGKSAATRLAEWWAKVWGGICDLFETVFQVDLPTIAEVQNAIKVWWADVVNGIKLSLGIDVGGASQKTGYYEGGRGGSDMSKRTVRYTENAKGAVFSKPTIFDTRLGYQMVGEAGAEAVAPIDVLQSYVAAAVASQNAGIASALERVVEAIESMDANMGGHMRDALEDTSLKVNNREFARMVKAVG